MNAEDNVSFEGRDKTGNIFRFEGIEGLLDNATSVVMTKDPMREWLDVTMRYRIGNAARVINTASEHVPINSRSKRHNVTLEPLCKHLLHLISTHIQQPL